MCPPFGSDETIMAYVMPLGGGIHRISSSQIGRLGQTIAITALRDALRVGETASSCVTQCIS
jgi:hypothetical protein